MFQIAEGGRECGRREGVRSKNRRLRGGGGVKGKNRGEGDN